MLSFTKIDPDTDQDFLTILRLLEDMDPLTSGSVIGSRGIAYDLPGFSRSLLNHSGLTSGSIFVRNSHWGCRYSFVLLYDLDLSLWLLVQKSVSSHRTVMLSYQKS